MHPTKGLLHPRKARLPRPRSSTRPLELAEKRDVPKVKRVPPAQGSGGHIWVCRVTRNTATRHGDICTLQTYEEMKGGKKTEAEPARLIVNTVLGANAKPYTVV